MIAYKIHEYRFVFREEDFSISIYYNRDLIDIYKGIFDMDEDTFFTWCYNWYRNNVY